MKTASASLAISVLVAAMVALPPVAAWAGSFRIGGAPLRLGVSAGSAGVVRLAPVGTGTTVTQRTAIVITNPDARPMDHLPFLHPFVRTFDVPRSAVVIETSVNVSTSNGKATQSTGQWVWQPGQWVWSDNGWAWWPGQWLWAQ